ncbi:MAG: rRNA pseudouridine synthase [Phycisphaerales bacterium]|nr:rRNA pseudouridine synthase [Phycisphaerales bacterium]
MTPERTSPRAPGRKHEFTDPSRGPRIQKVLAAAGIASRRDCEALIEEGIVKVNGQPVTTLPAWVDPVRDTITVRGKRIQRPEPFVYVMLFKPRGVVSTNDDPEGRPRAIDLVQHPERPRLYPVGRLDVESSGLLLLTNDGELAARITHPRYGIHKQYLVTVRGRLEEKDVKHLESGIFLTDPRGGHGSKTHKSKLTLMRRSRDRTRLLMELSEGRNRQIRRMLAHLGFPVKKLRRIKVGPLKLTGLRPGQWRDLEPSEVDTLLRVTKLLKSRRGKS